MNDLSAVPGLSSPPAKGTFGDMTVQLAKLSAASVCCIELLNTIPSLHEVASEGLRSFLPAGSRISNPDVIFVNTAGDAGGVKSISLSDALIHAMLHGADFLDDPKIGLYSRHDSIADALRYAPNEAARIRSVVRQLASTLPASFEGQVVAYWNKSQPLPNAPATSAPIKTILDEQQAEALRCEAEIHCATQTLSAQEKDALLQAFSAEVPEYGTSISIDAGQGSVWKLPMVAISPTARPDDGPAFLLLPGRGLERMASMQALIDNVVQRLTERAADDDLVRCLPVALREELERGLPLSHESIRTSPLDKPVVSHQMDAVRATQMIDFHHLCMSARARGHSNAVFLDQIFARNPAAYLNHAMGDRLETLMEQASSLFRPDWFRFGDENCRDEYTRLEQDHEQRRARVDAMFAGLDSPAEYGLQEIENYIRANLGYSIDPRQVMVSVPDTIMLKSGPVKTSYTKSLLEFALNGLPYATEAGTVELPRGRANPAFDFAFVRKLVEQVDVQRRYATNLRARYSEEGVQRALTHMRDSALALSVCAAVMQGHLLEPRSEELLHLVRSDGARRGSQLSMGSLLLAATGTRMRDVIVFREQRDDDDHYVLYAPGAPTGRDLFEGPWHKIASEIGRWSASEAGARYLHDQVSDGVGNDPKSFIEAIRLKPSLWGNRSVSFDVVNGQNFEEKLARLISFKVERTLKQLDATVVGLHRQTPQANGQTLAFIDARLDWLEQQFNVVTRDLQSYPDFVATQTRAIFERHLRSQGIDEPFDPDTLYFDMHRSVYISAPDFSEYTQLRSLTTLMAEGNHESFNPATPAYSSIGQFASGWPPKFFKFVERQLTEADLGARYIQYLRDRFLERRHADHGRRRELMGMRTQFQMRRAAMFHFLDGTLTAEQYDWLVSMIVGLDEQTLAGDSGLRRRLQGSAVLPFRIAGHIVEGVFMFRHFNTPDPLYNLLYTPNAPDGVQFRLVTDYADLLKSADMRSYYHRRVSYRGQPSVVTRFDEMARGHHKDASANRVHQPTKSSGDVITDVYKLYEAMISRMIDDTDARTTSTAERRAEVLYSIISQMGAIFLLPYPGAAIAWKVVTSGVDFFRGAIAYSYGDRAAALPYLLSAVKGILDASSALDTLTKGTLSFTEKQGYEVLLWLHRQASAGRGTGF